MEKVLIFTATYNEIKNIEELITRIKKNCKHADILIIDDKLCYIRVSYQLLYTNEKIIYFIMFLFHFCYSTSCFC